MRGTNISFFLLFLLLCTCGSWGWGQDGEVSQLRQKLQEMESKLRQKDQEYETLRDNFQELKERLDKIESQPATSSPNMEKRVSALEGIAEEIRQEQQEQDNLFFRMFWKNGFRMETPNKDFALRIGGRMLLDVAFANEDDAIQDQLDEIEDFVRFRAVRIRLSGVLYREFIFNMEVDFEGNVTFKDVYLGKKNLPANGVLKVGFMKEPLGLEEQTSLNSLTFLERASLRAFNPVRNIGILYTGDAYHQRISFAAGIYREVAQDDPPEVVDDSGGYAFTSRLAWIAYATRGEYQGKEKDLVLGHLGIGYSYRNPLNDEVQFRSRPEISEGPNFVNTGVLEDIEDVNLLGLEFLYLNGPFSVQSEVFFSWVRPKNDNINTTNQFWGFYAFISYFLSGEIRPYRRGKAALGKVVPHQDIVSDGWGAWEMALRYSYIDLDDGAVDGRRMHDITFGVNWYMTAHTRLMANYIYSLLNDLDDSDKTDAHILAMRLQVDF